MKSNKPCRTTSYLENVIPRRWPEYPNECHSDLKEFWNFREDLSVQNGLILKGDQPLIPSDLRTQMPQTIHQGHLGEKKCQLKARNCIFLLGISKDIMNMTASLRASSPIWASKASLARTRERGAEERRACNHLS